MKIKAYASNFGFIAGFNEFMEILWDGGMHLPLIFNTMTS